MVYKRVIERGGKKYTYFYENYRDENGVVRNRFIGKENPESKKRNKDFLLTFFTFLGLFIFIYTTTFIFNEGFNLSVNNQTSSDLGSKIIGLVISPSDEIIEHKVELNKSTLEIKSSKSKIKPSGSNKVMDFSFEDTRLRLSFDVVNYSSLLFNLQEENSSKTYSDGLSAFASKQKAGVSAGIKIDKENVRKIVEEFEEEKIKEIADSSIVEIEDFEIEIEKNNSVEVDYKWGYKFRLDSYDFIAKVDVSSNEDIELWNKNTLRIGNSLLSFEDLEREGYTVRIQKPSLEIEIGNSSDDLVEGILNESFNENIEVVEENDSSIFGEEDNSNLLLDGNNDSVNINDTDVLSNDSLEENNNLVEENNSLEEFVEDNLNNSDEEFSEDHIITGGVVNNFFNLVGSVVLGPQDLAGKVIDGVSFEEKLSSNISIYIEKDFRTTNYSIGDIVYLDPTLSLIPITDAYHLDPNREVISNIYDEVHELDDIWSPVINEGEYVRVTFEHELSKKRDITIFARSIANDSLVNLEVYEENQTRLIARFDNIKSQGELRKIFLTNLSEDENYKQGIFDLKVVGGSLEFDWIVDPTPTLVSADSELNGLEYPGTRNLVRLDSGRLVAVWEDNGNDIACSYSDNDGTSWSTPINSLTGGAALQYPSVSTNGTQVLIVAEATASNAIVYGVANGGCPADEFVPQSISTFSGVSGKPSLEYDGTTDKFVMCYVDDSTDLAFAYVDVNSAYSTGWTKSVIKSTSTIQNCGLSVDLDGEIHLCADDDEGTDFIWYMKSDDLFATTQYDKSLSEDTLVECDISARDGNVAVVSRSSVSDLYLWYSDSDGANFNYNLTDTDEYQGVTVCLDNQGTAQLLYVDTTGNDPLEYRNYTSVGGLGTEVDLALNSGVIWSYNSMLCHGYPENNRMQNGLLEFLIFQDTADDIYFANYSISYTPTNNIPTAPTLSLYSGSSTNTTSENLFLSITNLSDADNDTIYNVTDWRVDGNSIAFVNYPFDVQEFSTITDFSTYSNDGTINGATYNSSGQVGGAYSLDGSNDYIEIPYLGTSGIWNISYNYTIEMWVKPNVPSSGSKYIYSSCSGLDAQGQCIKIASDGKFYFTLTDAVNVGSSAVKTLTYPATNGAWQHIAFSFDNVTAKVYVDGTLVNSTSVSGGLASSLASAYLGRDLFNANFFNGSVDEFKIYNRTLSAQQILQNYLYGSSSVSIYGMLSYETRIGDNWTVEVTPNDLKDYGTSVLSNELIIINNIPSDYNSVILNSSSGTNTTNENLTVHLSGSTDSDSNPIYNITDWRINGSSYAVLNLPFDEKNLTNVTDFSTYSNDGYVNGSSYTFSGKIGGAYSFDGANDNILIPDSNSLDLGSNFTISFWSYYDSDIGIVGLVGKGDSTTFSYKTSTLDGGLFGYQDALVAQVSSDGTSADLSIIVNNSLSGLANTWLFHAVTYNGTTLNLYINDTLIGSATGNIIPFNDDGGVVLGSATALNLPLNGMLDNIMIFNKTLSEEQLFSLYSEGLSGKTLETIVSQETTLGQNWTVMATPTDLYDVGNSTLSNPLLIKEESSNTAPTISLTSPADNNVTTDRTPTFTYAGSDSEGDSLVYDIYLNCTGGCSADNRVESAYLGTTYTPSTDLLYLSDNNYWYNWTVRACENETVDLFCSDWATYRTINISALVSINLTTDFIEFGSLSIGVSNNTTADGLNPFLMQNIGNSRVNVTINASSIFDSVVGDSVYYQCKAGNYTGNATWADTSWFNVPITGSVVFVDSLNYSDDSDSLEVDILLDVPANEPGGAKTSTVNFEASLSEL